MAHLFLSFCTHFWEMAFALLINVRSFVRSFVSQEVQMMAHHNLSFCAHCWEMAFALLINVRSFVRSFVSQEVKMMAHRNLFFCAHSEFSWHLLCWSTFAPSFVSQEVKMMAHRIILMRSVLRKNLEELNTPWQWVSVLWGYVSQESCLFAFVRFCKAHAN
jgi:hypothetical protein